MDTWAAISTSRNVRRFSERPIPAEALDRIVDAARLAPSSKNEQRWAFVVCTDRGHLRELAHVGDYAGHLAGAAAAVALVTPNAAEVWKRESIAFDAGQASENAMLAAWELGIGTFHASVYDESLARDLLGLSRGHALRRAHRTGLSRRPEDLRAAAAEPAAARRGPARRALPRVGTASVGRPPRRSSDRVSSLSSFIDRGLLRPERRSRRPRRRCASDGAAKH